MQVDDNKQNNDNNDNGNNQDTDDNNLTIDDNVKFLEIMLDKIKKNKMDINGSKAQIINQVIDIAVYNCDVLTRLHGLLEFLLPQIDAVKDGMYAWPQYCKQIVEKADVIIKPVISSQLGVTKSQSVGITFIINGFTIVISGSQYNIFLKLSLITTRKKIPHVFNVQNRFQAREFKVILKLKAANTTKHKQYLLVLCINDLNQMLRLINCCAHFGEEDLLQTNINTMKYICNKLTENGVNVKRSLKKLSKKKKIKFAKNLLEKLNDDIDVIDNVQIDATTSAIKFGIEEWKQIEEQMIIAQTKTKKRYCEYTQQIANVAFGAFEKGKDELCIQLKKLLCDKRGNAKRSYNTKIKTMDNLINKLAIETEEKLTCDSTKIDYVFIAKQQMNGLFAKPINALKNKKTTQKHVPMTSAQKRYWYFQKRLKFIQYTGKLYQHADILRQKNNDDDSDDDDGSDSDDDDDSDSDDDDESESDEN